MTTLAKQMRDMFKIDNRHQWLRDADLTYCAARHLLLSEDIIFRPVGGYLLHLAVEKYFKAIRKVVRPQIDSKRGGHDLHSLHASLVRKVKAFDTPELCMAIEKIADLEKWRYVDTISLKSRQKMNEGLAAADFIVTTARGEIRDEVLFQGLRSLLSNKGLHRQLLVKSLLQCNAHYAYWKCALFGVDKQLDAMIRKYAGN